MAYRLPFGVIIEAMKSNPKTSGEYTAFENLLRRVIQVPHSEIKTKLQQEKRDKAQKRKHRKEQQK
jgi:hypothetical protein